MLEKEYGWGIEDSEEEWKVAIYKDDERKNNSSLCDHVKVRFMVCRSLGPIMNQMIRNISWCGAIGTLALSMQY